MSAQQRIDEFYKNLQIIKSMPGADIEFDLPRFPLTMRVGFHDRAGAQFYDRDGKPVLVELVKDEELAVQLEWLLNALAKRAGLLT